LKDGSKSENKKNSFLEFNHKNISEIEDKIDRAIFKKNNSPRRKRSNPKQVKAKKFSLFAGGQKNSNKVKTKKMETTRQTEEIKHNSEKSLNFSKVPRIRINSGKEKEAKLAEREKQKQEQLELKKAKAEAIESENKAKLAEREKQKQEQLELKKAKTEAIGAERKAKLAEREKQKQEQLESKKAKTEAIGAERKAKLAEREKQKQEQLELKKAKTEAIGAEKKAKIVEREKQKQEQLELKKAKAEAIEAEEKRSKDKSLVMSDSLNKEKYHSKSKSLFSGLKANDTRQSNKQVKKAFTEREKVLKKRFDSGKVIRPITPDENKDKSDLLHISEIKTEEIKDDIDLNFGNIDRLKFNTLDKLGLSKKDSWEEIEFYSLIDQFAYAGVIRETATLDKLYILVEIELSEKESKSLKFIREVLEGFTLNSDEFESKGKDKYLKEKIEEIIEDYSIKIDETSKKKIIYFLEKQLLGLDKLEPIMNDPNIEDISCDGSDVPIFLYHRKYGSLKSNIKLENEDELSNFVVKLSQKCGKHISIANPMLDSTMPDGSRIQMTLSTEVTTKGSTFTIRKFRENPFSPTDLIEFNTMSSEIVAFLWMAVENGINALIAGGTASGKTSTLNALALFIPPESKIVSIEETRELNLPHKNWIPGVARVGFGEVIGDKIVGEIDMYELMKAALRQRPEYILVGEIRGREAYVLFQAMATGHTTYSTVHADSAKSLVHRLEGKPIEIPRIMLQSLDIVSIQAISRVKDKRLRRCKQIIEIIDIDPATKEILTNEVFRWDPIEDTFTYSGKSYVLERIRTEKNLSREEMTEEIRKRAALLEWMRKKNITGFKEVAAMIANYTENQFEVMEKIKEDI